MSLTVADSSLSRLTSHADTSLTSYLVSTYWPWKIIAVCIGVSMVHMLLSNPSSLYIYAQFWKSIRAGHEFDSYAVVKAQAVTFYKDAGFSHFASTHYGSAGHWHKMRFRLLLPWLIATFHIRHVGLTIVTGQLVLSVLFLRLLVTLAQRLLEDKINTFLFVLGFSLLYPVRAAWLDIAAYGDFFAYFFLLLAIYANRPAWVFICLQLAFWTDERALVNAVFVWLWYGLDAYFRPRPYRLTPNQWAVLWSGLVYVLLRYYLSQSVHFSLVDTAYWAEFSSTYYENIKVIGFRLWSGFMGHWFLLVLSIILLVYERRYQVALVFSGTLLLTLNLSFIVYDVNRAISYGYIAIFIALALLRRSLSPVELRRLLMFVLVAMLLTPLPNRLRLPGGYTLS